MTTQAQAQTAIDLATKWIGKGIDFVAGHRAYAVEQAPTAHDDGFSIRFTNEHYEAEIDGIWQQITVADFAD